MRIILFIFFFSWTLNCFGQTVTIGILPFNPPFEMEADKKGHYFGFDVDLMNAICTRGQMECQFISGTLPELFNLLSKGKIDLAMGAISITPQRQQTYLFSLPYLASYGHFITKQNSKIQSISDLIGKRVGVLKGSLYQQLAKDILNNQVNVIEFDASSGIIEGLINGKIDAALMDEGSAWYWKAANDQIIKLLGDHYKVGIGYGIISTMDNKKLIAQINQVLLKIESNGTYLKIYNRYFNDIMTSQ